MNHVRSTAAPRPDQRVAGNGRTLPDALWAQAASRGAAPALLHKRLGIWRRWRWAEAAEEVRRIGRGLLAHGIGPGDRVLIAGRSRPRLALALTACQWRGAVPVLLAEENAAEFGRALAEQRPRAVFLATEHEVALLRAALAGSGDAPLVICDAVAGPLDASVLAADALIEQAAHATSVPAASTDEDLAAILYEATDSGPSRPVALTHSELIDRAGEGIRALALTARDRVFGGLPLGWGGALLLGHVQSLCAGFPIAYPESDATALDDLREAGPTLLFGPPLLFRHLRQAAFLRAAASRGRWQRALDAALGFGGAHGGWVPGRLIAAAARDQLGLSQVRSALVFGGVVAPQVARFFAAIGIPVRAVYAPAQAGFFAALGESAAPAAMRPLDGIAVTADADGEILVRSGGNASWRATGDRGTVSADGRLTWSGRITDSPRLPGADGIVLVALEAQLRGSLFIRDACVLATPNRRLAALVAADLEALAAWARTHGVAMRSAVALLRDERILELLAQEIAAADPTGRIAQFAIVPAGFDAGSGAVTPQGALRRAELLRGHADTVATLHAGAGLPVAAPAAVLPNVPVPQMAHEAAMAAAAT